MDKFLGRLAVVLLACAFFALGSSIDFVDAADDPASNVIPGIRISDHTVHELNRMSDRVGWESAAVPGGTRLVCLVVVVDDFTPETRAELKAAMLAVEGVSRVALAFRGQLPATE